MEKTEYQKWLDGRLIDYSALGELSWTAALSTVLDHVRAHPTGSLSKSEIAELVLKLSK